MKTLFASHLRNTIVAASLFFCTLSSTPVWSYQVLPGEYEWLPVWCRYMQSSNYKPQDPQKAAKWRAYLGPNWLHDHHFCWGLSLRMKAFKESDEGRRNNYFKDVIQNMEYVLRRSSGPHIIEHETYYYMAEAYEMQGKKHLAERYYLQALDTKPTYLQGILKLIDFYRGENRIALAFEYLRKGLEAHPNSRALARRKAKLEKLK